MKKGDSIVFQLNFVEGKGQADRYFSYYRQLLKTRRLGRFCREAFIEKADRTLNGFEEQYTHLNRFIQSKGIPFILEAIREKEARAASAPADGIENAVNQIMAALIEKLQSQPELGFRQPHLEGAQHPPNIQPATVQQSRSHHGEQAEPHSELRDAAVPQASAAAPIAVPDGTVQQIAAQVTGTHDALKQQTDIEGKTKVYDPAATHDDVKLAQEAYDRAHTQAPPTQLNERLKQRAAVNPTQEEHAPPAQQTAEKPTVVAHAGSEPQVVAQPTKAHATSEHQPMVKSTQEVQARPEQHAVTRPTPVAHAASEPQASVQPTKAHATSEQQPMAKSTQEVQARLEQHAVTRPTPVAHAASEPQASLQPTQAHATSEHQPMVKLTQEVQARPEQHAGTWPAPIADAASEPLASVQPTEAAHAQPEPQAVAKATTAVHAGPEPQPVSHTSAQLSAPADAHTAMHNNAPVRPGHQPRNGLQPGASASASAAARPTLSQQTPRAGTQSTLHRGLDRDWESSLPENPPGVYSQRVHDELCEQADSSSDNGRHHTPSQHSHMEAAHDPSVASRQHLPTRPERDPRPTLHASSAAASRKDSATPKHKPDMGRLLALL
ncbi:hypothetical protein [Paenibacillus xerothermodurans]|uniref:Uncharacterized protein n=1 Tax=Paenibacillus xerothermodurans TaxID=1977292 RepID=A0A2W1N8H4_PAEXE|nr:hypothetical protein [Paenibacillus xerothermodurans]PZE20194.1 hypothetical protein CBW46_015005 [Paenibacillus xerothermodurans]